MLARLRLLTISGLVLALANPGSAQQLPTLAAPVKGETQSMTLQTGSRSQLTFGSSTSIGTSASLNATDGSQATTKASLAPVQGGTVLFRIGSDEKSNASPITANIENLKTSGSGTTNLSSSTIEGNNVNGSSGQAQITGIQSQLSFTIDSSRSEFSSTATTIPNASNSDNSTTDTASVQNTSTTSPVTSTTTPTTTTNNRVANTSGAANISSNTNVDINNTNFTNVFMQAF